MAILRSGNFKRQLRTGSTLLMLLVAAIVVAVRYLHKDERAKPRVAFMSSISLIWGDGGLKSTVRGKSEPMPIYSELAREYAMLPLDDATKIGAVKPSLLLLIQPRGLAAEAYVAIDDWVNAGGAVVIFADPALQWPSSLPLGDPRRPLFTSLMNPLFRHWGVELALPAIDDEARHMVGAGSYRLRMNSRGIWSKAKKPGIGQCRIDKSETLAICRVGKGLALLVADADMLDEDNWEASMFADGNLEWTKAALGHVIRRESLPGKMWDRPEK